MVKEHYAKTVRYEWRRLVQDPYHRLEFDTTMHFLKKYLPKRGLILDAGGGPGRYTVELAKQGYDVVLLDVTPELLEFAKKQIKKEGLQNKVKEIVEGSIVDLSTFSDNTFDAVLCLGGVLSHIKGQAKRNKAVLELIRVAKHGAPIFVSVMSRLGVLIGSLRCWPAEIKTENFRRVVIKGDDYRWWGKYYAHFFFPEELRQLFEDKGVKILEMVGLQGLSTHSQRQLNKLAKTDKKGWKNWIWAHYKLCTHPAVVGMSEHFLLICRKL